MEKCTNEYYISNGEIFKANNFEKISELEGITLYEVIRVINGIPLFIEEHLERFGNTCRLTNVEIKYSKELLKEQLMKLININSVQDGNVKVIFNKNLEDRLSMYFIEHSYPSEAMYKNGVDTILYFGERTNPNAKVINNDFRNNVNLKIKEADVYEAILVDDNKNITEGSRSNIFMIKGDKIYTAPIKTVLPGITRDRIMKLLNKIKLNTIEQEINYKDIFEMDAVFITGTSPKVLPICKIDGVNIPSTSNEILKTIINSYNLLIENYVESSL